MKIPPTPPTSTPTGNRVGVHKEPNGPAVPDALSEERSVRSLNFYGLTTDAEMRELQALVRRSKKELEEFSLANTRLSLNDGLELLAALGKCPKLRSLDLPFCHMRYDLMAELSVIIPRLEAFSISFFPSAYPLTDQEKADFAQAFIQGQLRSVSFSQRQDLVESGKESLPARCYPNVNPGTIAGNLLKTSQRLEWLDLTGVGLTAEEQKRLIEGLQSNSSLRELRLERNFLYQEEMQALLASLQNHPKINEVHLGGLRKEPLALDAALVKQISRLLTDHPTLHTLSLHGVSIEKQDETLLALSLIPGRRVYLKASNGAVERVIEHRAPPTNLPDGRLGRSCNDTADSGEGFLSGNPDDTLPLYKSW